MTDSPPVPKPAATVVLLRPAATGDEPELLLIQRPATMAFGPGLHVFPGGKVDPGDADPSLTGQSARSAEEAAEILGGNVEPGEALALHVAAIRELHEEVGVHLGDQLAAPAARLWTDRLVPIAHWTTPPFMPRRYSTWFFVADLPPGVDPTFAADEVAAHRWITPTAALELMADGQIAMWVPTSCVLQVLIELGARTAADVAVRLSLARVAPPRVLAESPDLAEISFGAAGGVPGRARSLTIHGQRDLIVVDPGDPSEDVHDAIEAVVDGRGGAIRAIVLTAPDPGHAAGAEGLAIPSEIPILVAPGAGRHLPYATRELVAGERLPCDVDRRVRLGPPGSGRLSVVAPSAGE